MHLYGTSDLMASCSSILYDLYNLDMEGVLRLENWIAFAGKMGRTDFKRTTRDDIGR